MSWNTGIPTPYHLSQITAPNTGLLAARQLDLTAINTANCPSNLPTFEGEDRLWGGSDKVGLVWICFTNDITDDADPGSGALGDATGNRFSDLYPKLYAYDPAGKQYMVIYDPDADNTYTVRHCF
jgi:hypothetical protein